VIRFVPAAAALVFLGGPSSTRPVEVVQIPTARFEAGPALAWNALIWTEKAKDGSVSARAAVGGRIRTIFRAAKPAVPPEAPASPGYNVSVLQHAWAAASPTTVAVLRSVALVYVPKCRPACGAPTVLRPFFAELWVGSPQGGLHRVAGRRPVFGPGCTNVLPTSVDVDGADVLDSELTETCDGMEPVPRGSRVVLRRGRAATRTVVTLPRRSEEVALAGRFIGWRDANEAVAVYDLRRRRVAYRVQPVVLGFDLQADGTSAIVGEQAVAWASPRKPEPHRLRGGAYGGYVRIAGGRIAFASQVTNGRTWRTSVALVDLRNRLTTLAAYQGSFPSSASVTYVDFDGRSVAFALERYPRGVVSLYRLAA
jgi:hypothetical protein